MFANCAESCLWYSLQQHGVRATRGFGRQACTLLGPLKLAFRAALVVMIKEPFIALQCVSYLLESAPKSTRDN